MEVGGVIVDAETGNPAVAPIVEPEPPSEYHLTNDGRSILEKKLGRPAGELTDRELMDAIPDADWTYSWHKDWEILEGWGLAYRK